MTMVLIESAETLKIYLSMVETIKEMGVILKLHKENMTFNGSRSDLYSDWMLTILSGFA